MHDGFSFANELEVVTPMDFNSMPIGSVVSKGATIYYFFKCTYQSASINIALSPASGMKIVNGVTANYFNINWNENNFLEGNVYTTPEAEARGLGFVFGAYSITRELTCHVVSQGWRYPRHAWSVGEFHPLATGTLQSVLWCPTYTDSQIGDDIKVYISYSVVKINNPGGQVPLPGNFDLNFMNLNITKGSEFSNISIIHNITAFESRVHVRTCATPMASESVIYFGQWFTQDVQNTAAGNAITTRNFSLNFSCPSGYQTISFFVEPMHGKADGDYGEQGVMKIAQGAGMATGVGVRLEWRRSSWGAQFENVVYRTNPPYNAQYGDAHGKYYLGSGGTTYTFRASLVRLPEPVAPGQIKAAALIHIRYN